MDFRISIFFTIFVGFKDRVSQTLQEIIAKGLSLMKAATLVSVSKEQTND